MKLFSCTIEGRPFVKKNQQKMFGSGRRKHVVYSPQYQKWASCAALAIRQEKLKTLLAFPISVPVNLRALFYFKDRQGEPDLSALYEGIQDVLEKEGVILNDKLIHGHDGSRKFFGHEPRMEVELTVKQE